MTKRLNREKQTEVLLRTQEQRKSQKREQVLQAIKEIQQSERPLTFANIARVAGCSVSYLYKWSELSTYIHDLQNQNHQNLNEIEEKEPRPHSFKTLHDVSKRRIRELEEENRELKRQNEKLRGHVTEIYEIREECKRLQEQIRKLTAPQSRGNVVPIQATSTLSTQKLIPSPEKNEAVFQQITDSIRRLGIQPGKRLLQEIYKHSPEDVKLSIEAYEQYRQKTNVTSPGACLLQMIQEEAKPNILQKASSSKLEEFDCWYTEAIKAGFVEDVPKNWLPSLGNKIQVKVKDEGSPSGYILMDWQQAQSLMLKN